MQIYIHKNGQQLGPYSVEEIKGFLQEGKISPNDLGWYEGAADWMSLASIPQLGIGRTLPPVVPGISQQTPQQISPQVTMGGANPSGMAPTIVQVVQQVGTVNPDANVFVDNRCSRTVYVLLALFLGGGFGVHNFYAKRIVPAIIQLVLGLTCYGLAITWIWAIIDCIVVKHDGKGRQMK